jgi:hypothetical protein
MSPTRSKRGLPFTRPERAALLERFRAAWTAVEAAELRADPDVEAAADGRRRMAEVAGEYVEAVPIVAVSRSPVDGEVFETSLDTYGVDGLWWAYDYEYRPWVAPPRTFFAWTGSLKLDGPVPEWSLKAMVGPEVPFVLPRILDHPAISAVVSTIGVGPHVGYPIAYFADPVPQDLERVDDWGHRSYSFVRPDGSPGSAHSTQDDAEKDFELRRWLDEGKLLWIAPGDASLTLRRGADGCPFLELPGERRRRYIQEGDTWLA